MPDRLDLLEACVRELLAVVKPEGWQETLERLREARTPALLAEVSRLRQTAGLAESTLRDVAGSYPITGADALQSARDLRVKAMAALEALGPAAGEAALREACRAALAELECDPLEMSMEMKAAEILRAAVETPTPKDPTP